MPLPLAELIGPSAQISALRESVQRLLERHADSARTTPILILGETGTGKSLLISLIHRASRRAGGPLVTVNCAAIPETLLEAELFGFERGAFTDARHAKPGLIETAHGGTLLLDEVGLLPPALQAKLLGVLEHRTVRRLGGTQDTAADVWLMAATNVELAAAVEAGRFRADLYHRLAVLTLRLPPLRERRGDIVHLAEHLLARACAHAGIPPKTLGAEARIALGAYEWPGNIRELANRLERVAMLGDGVVVSGAELELPVPASPNGAARETPVGQGAASRRTGATGELPDRNQLVQALRETGWNLSRTAERLGTSRNTLRTWIARHGLTPEPTEPSGPRSSVPSAGPQSIGNLPRPLTSFVGREREMAAVRELLGRTRLVTLTGAGGSGKTRLALETAASVTADFPDGVWLVELAALEDPGLVPDTVASGMGIREEPPHAILDTLIASLGARRLLLVLDNCEHLIGACAQLVGTLLNASAGLRVLATSREALDLAGETTWRVPTLSLPTPDRLPPTDELAQYEAVRLFIERAAAVEPTFALTDRNALAVAQVCYRLDGIPLAIELAAARIGVLTVEQINARLHDRFRLLTGGSRAWLPRQQTLRAAMDWSHELLSSTERVLFRRLAVFAGTFSLDAMEAVAAEVEVSGAEVLDILGALVDKSLVHADVSGKEGRYRLLETVRAYASEKLRDAGEERALTVRHLDWYLALAERAERMFEDARHGGEQVAWLDRLETEYDNLRAALALRDLEAHRAEARLRLAAALWRFWEVRGRQGEGRGWLEAILAETPSTPSNARANALNGAGNLARNQGDFAHATTHHEAALALRRALGNTRGVAGSLNNLAVVLHDRADYARAVELLEQALPLWTEAGHSFGVALSLNNLGRAVRFQGQYARASALCGESLKSFRALGHTWGIARALNSLGDVTRYGDEPARAARLYEESLALRQEVGDKHGIAVSANNLGDLARMRGDLAAAATFCERSLDLRRELGDTRGVAIALQSLGLVARDGGDLDRAMTLSRSSLMTKWELDDRAGLAWSLEAVASIAARLDDADLAACLLGVADALRTAIGAPRPPSAAADHESTTARAQALIGVDRFAKAWRAGGAMPLARAVAEAAAAATGEARE